MKNFIKRYRINSLKKKHKELLELTHKYSTTDRKKSDGYYLEARYIEDKLLKLTGHNNERTS